MKYEALTITTLLASAFARPDIYTTKRHHARDLKVERGSYMKPRWNNELQRREVPQEHSHEQFLTTVRASLNLNNPAGITDVVFGLLGDAAGSAGQGSITDTDCLQQATADQAFTNAKAAGDVNGMTAALIYRALERNTGKVGLASVPCTSMQAVNPEIAAIQQHQDPASTGAAATNKAITLELAKQIASIGGTATDALKAGTFAPGNLDDNTGKGNSCDDANDSVGCIFSQNLLVEDATVDEINAAVAGTSTTSNSTSTPASTNSTSVIPAVNSSIVSLTDSASVSISTVTMMMTVTQLQTDSAVATAPVDAAAATASSPPMMASADVSSVVSAMMVSMTVAAVAEATAASTTAVSSTGAAAVDCSGQIASALAAAGMTTPSTASNVSNSSTSAPIASSSTAFANTTTPTRTSSIDLGSCANPTIIFANGLDGRNEPAFAPADETTFTHGSALGIKVITDFICQQLQTKCNASQATIDACNQGATAAQGTSGQAAADAFNAALGF